ncbi:MAG: MoaD/ThiS family protein [Chlamydiae bacterium]|nr:MoaD/ThiS family protein [Chlamydiota bacterium]MBI3277140.1 MoaD/ThiS family protein [Chlamydiota bacterium]
MKVKVLFFAQLRDIFGQDKRILDLPEAMTIDEALKILFEESRLKSLASLPLLYGLNENWAQGDERLQDQDTLALLPPVAGG